MLNQSVYRLILLFNVTYIVHYCIVLSLSRWLVPGGILLLVLECSDARRCVVAEATFY